MQHDEVIWQAIRHNHCSFMTKSSCPLANSRYATIREHEGVFYLYMKTIERAHMPNKLCERVELPKNYEKALEIIYKHMMYWPKFLVHKTKQRLTKMTQMWIRMRKLAPKTREKIMTIPRKEKKREARRKEKAEMAAALHKRIEDELLERLKEGVYPAREEEVEVEDEEEHVIEYVEGYEEIEEEDDIEDFGGLALAQGDDDDDDDEDEETVAVDQKRGRRSIQRKHDKDDTSFNFKKRAKVLFEVEYEDTAERQVAVE